MTYTKDKIDVKMAKMKIEHWCAYQERSHFDVRNKLFEWNLYASEVNLIIADLISDNFLNEERFAFAYVSGKFKINKWGRIKIKMGLKAKQIPPKLILQALNSIDSVQYEKVISDLLHKKHALIKEKNGLKHQFKLVNYLISRGFEKDVVFDVLKSNNLYN